MNRFGHVKEKRKKIAFKTYFRGHCGCKKEEFNNENYPN